MLIQRELSCLLALVTVVVQALPALGPHDGPLMFPNPPDVAAPPVNRSSSGTFGNRQFDDEDVCHVSHTCKDRGKRYWDQLIATISLPNPVDRTDGLDKFREYYSTEIAMLGDHILQLHDDLENHGFETKYVQGWATFSMNPDTGEETVDTAYRNLFYTFKGLIIADENFRDADEQKKLPWSELMYMTWHSAKQRADWWHHRDPTLPGGGPISTLQTVISAKCVNEETQAVIKEIWDAQGLEWNTGDPIWYRYTLAELAAAGKADWFYSLVGTDNIKGAVWLLNDHAAEIGKKVITEIWVRWTWVDPDIWINIGPYTLETAAVSVA
ncbi:MAG: hypothetical protein Q9171_001028 [Xanthocarpia ochracea]